MPAHPGAGEDEGWLMGLVINTVEETTDLAILDAQSFEAPPVATVRLPHRVPPGFHGNWFPGRQASGLNAQCDTAAGNMRNANVRGTAAA